MRLLALGKFYGACFLARELGNNFSNRFARFFNFFRLERDCTHDGVTAATFASIAASHTVLATPQP